MQDPSEIGMWEMMVGVREQEEEVKCPCPRCSSRNTKFCYYNNYNMSQPRHYCKACRRYWTKGGSLRNIPVGGASRKRSSSSSSSSSSSKRTSSANQLQLGPTSLPLNEGVGPIPIHNGDTTPPTSWTPTANASASASASPHLPI